MFRRYLITGILIWAPIWVTFLVLKFVIDLFDKIFSLLPAQYQPDHVLGYHVPGFGVLFALFVVVVTGVLMTNILGHRILALGEKLLTKIPLVRSIYTAVKQVLHSLLSSSEQSFRKVLLVEYPRKEMWTIAFQTNVGFDGGVDSVNQDLITVFIPTTPNPTSGFMVLVPRKDVIQLDISVDEALKMVISLGVVVPKKETNVGEKNA